MLGFRISYVCKIETYTTAVVFYSNKLDFCMQIILLVMNSCTKLNDQLEPQSYRRSRNCRLLAILTILKQFARSRTCAKFENIISKLIYYTV